MNSELPLLYSFWRSSCSFRVRIALSLKEIPYNVKTIKIDDKENLEQNSPSYQAVNPLQKVPALIIDGHTIVESLNIMHYLEETRPQIPLMPSNVHRRAKVREICEMIQSGIQPLQNIGALHKIQTFASKDKSLEWAQHWIQIGFTAVEKVLSTSSGNYCVGDDITFADCCLIPQVYNARKYRIDLHHYPTILKINQQLENHPAFLKAHPLSQPDCPAKP